MKVNSYSEIPVSADALMYEEENAHAAEEMTRMPSEEEILNQIFGDRPKQYGMSLGTKAGAQTFSINLSASEITSVRDEEMPAPSKAKNAAESESPVSDEAKEKTKEKTKEKPKDKPKKKPAKKATEKEPAKPKKVQRIVSPDEFFGDDTSPVGRRLKSMKLDTTVIEDDEKFAAQLAALEHGEKKKSKRTMEAADSNLDAQAAVDDPAVAAAAQALLEAEGISVESDDSEVTDEI